MPWRERERRGGGAKQCRMFSEKSKQHLKDDSELENGRQSVIQKEEK